MPLSRLHDNQHIEIFDLAEADDTIFGNDRRYDFYQIVWFTEAGGDARYFLDFEEYKLENDQIVVVFPGQIDRLDIRGKKGYLFAVRSEVFFNINRRLNSDFLNGYLSNIIITLDSVTRTVLEQLMHLILTEYRSAKRLRLLESYLEIFLFHVNSLLTAPQTGGYDTVVAQMMKLIDENFASQRETEFYASQLNLSCKRLNEASRRGTGKTVKQHLQERLALEIKRDILLGRKSLKEIAFSLGFSEAAYFTRFFKQQTGITPSEFRDRAHSFKY